MCACTDLSTIQPIDINATIHNLENAAANVALQSDAWRRQVDRSVNDLRDGVHDAIANDLRSVVDGAIQSSANQVRCTVDFLRDRVSEDLRRIVAQLRGQPAPRLQPHFCDGPAPATVDLDENPTRFKPLKISGYNLQDRETGRHDLGLVLLDSNDQALRRDSWLAVSSPYSAVISIDQGRGCELEQKGSELLRLTLNGERVMDIPVKQRTRAPYTPDTGAQTIPLTKFTPPHVRGDRDFWTYLDIKVRVNLEVTMRATEDVVQARVEMRAREWDVNQNRAYGDKTEADGRSAWRTVYTAPSGSRIKRLLGTTRYAAEHFVAKDEPSLSGTHPVHHYILYGDQGGADSGSYTGVKVFLQPIQVELESISPWCR